MESFELPSNKKIGLKLLKATEIQIKKISLEGSNTISHLFQPIAIETIYPTGRKEKNILNPIVYFSNTHPGLVTDEPIDLIVKNCDLTSMQIFNPQNHKFSFRIYYTKPKYGLKDINVKINQDLDGYVYSLSMIEMEKIKQYFPNSNPVGQIFINGSQKLDFEALHGDILPHILPTLTGLTNEELLNIRKINIEKY